MWGMVKLENPGMKYTKLFDKLTNPSVAEILQTFETTYKQLMYRADQMVIKNTEYKAAEVVAKQQQADCMKEAAAAVSAAEQIAKILGKTK